MPTVYEQILAAREDMTEWLVHFTHGNDDGLTARSVLAKILAEGLLRPGWAPRRTNSGTRNTVFGPRPAVCFSEQPVGALINYVGRRDYAKPYGVFVHKMDAWADGVMPVIYGLNADSEVGDDDPAYVAGQRTLKPSVLSLDEQYRYVSLALHRYGAVPLDWTHEREWRWSSPRGNAINDCFPLAGSGTFSSRGHSDGRVHVFVQHDGDVAWFKTHLTAKWNAVRSSSTDEEHISYCDRWFGRLRQKIRVFSLEEASRELAAGNRSVYRLETWLPVHTRVPIV